MHDFPQWNHDEVSFLHQGMRNLEIGLVDVEVVVEKNINIDDAVVILAIHRLEGTPHLLLHTLSGLEQLARR